MFFLFFNSKFMDAYVRFGVGNNLLDSDGIITDANIIRCSVKIGFKKFSDFTRCMIYAVNISSDNG